MKQLCCVFQLAAVFRERRTLTTVLSTALATSYVALVHEASGLESFQVITFCQLRSSDL